MADPRTPDIAQLAREFGRRSDISARSVLVTIFGDSVVPMGGAIWLGDLINLCEPFGFSDRLVRTSMFRLTAEGWFATERVGRRSQYRLTDFGVAEFEAAERRIYSLPDIDWDGTWTLVFVDSAGLDRETRDEVVASLHQQGFAPLSTGVMAAPRHETGAPVRLAGHNGSGNSPPIATAKFHDLEELVAGDRLFRAFSLEEPAKRYQEFVDRYSWTTALDEINLSDRDAFLLRTMLIHDLRRPRLADPDLPAELLPEHWPAPQAMQIAMGAYHQLIPASESWPGAVTGDRSARRGASQVLGGMADSSSRQIAQH